MLLVSHNSQHEATSMSDATSVDPMAVLFRLEEELSVLDVQRLAPTTVKIIIEQTAGRARVRHMGC
jgi:hypothetical protein